jgi:hypothetical protein
VSAGWVAATVRGRGLARRRLGEDGARHLARSASLPSALAALGTTPYGRGLRTDMDLATAQHTVSAAVLWHLRVLAGWGPPLGAGPLRLVAAGFEIANVSGQLARLSGQPAQAPYALGSMATAWPAVSRARTPAEVRAALRASGWGDPGSDDPAAVRLAMQLAWARRVFDDVPGGAEAAIGGAALVVARVLAAGARATLSPSAHRDATHLLGPQWHEAVSPEDLTRHVSRRATQALRGVEHAEDLWHAEMRWWSAVEATGATLVARSEAGAAAGVGVAALLAADAWRVRAALALAAGGGGDLAEVLDAVA